MSHLLVGSNGFAMGVLDFAETYRVIRRLTGSELLNRTFVKEYVKPYPGMRLLDIGCGPADVITWLPIDQIEYIGIDSNENYVRDAREKHGDRAKFLCEDLGTSDYKKLGSFDRIIAMGVLHHISESSVLALLETVKTLLSPGGFFVSYDPCFTPKQNPVARLVHRLDRGDFVRYESELFELVSRVFPKVEKSMRTDICAIPSSNLILKAQV